MKKADPIRFAGVLDRTTLRRLANTEDREIVLTIKVPFLYKSAINKLDAIEGSIEFGAEAQ